MRLANGSLFMVPRVRGHRQRFFIWSQNAAARDQLGFNHVRVWNGVSRRRDNPNVAVVVFGIANFNVNPLALVVSEIGMQIPEPLLPPRHAILSHPPPLTLHPTLPQLP